jgi:hypothetical protein
MRRYEEVPFHKVWNVDMRIAGATRLLMVTFVAVCDLLTC